MTSATPPQQRVPKRRSRYWLLHDTTCERETGWIWLDTDIELQWLAHGRVFTQPQHRDAFERALLGIWEKPRRVRRKPVIATPPNVRRHYLL